MSIDDWLGHMDTDEVLEVTPVDCRLAKKTAVKAENEAFCIFFAKNDACLSRFEPFSLADEVIDTFLRHFRPVHST